MICENGTDLLSLKPGAENLLSARLATSPIWLQAAFSFPTPLPAMVSLTRQWIPSLTRVSAVCPTNRATSASTPPMPYPDIKNSSSTPTCETLSANSWAGSKRSSSSAHSCGITAQAAGVPASITTSFSFGTGTLNFSLRGYQWAIVQLRVED